ncbi:condensin complex subunit 2 [Lepeophtheirus salmonis]|uniref:Condensin complex subunit 2 n=1 Tax=Lepeophtheirus salmonis TaxID=72036 RepID=A0A0K2TRL2_LEPSM|nr:condensin complex subunit 2-like [Lepeophtheirus salmonis]
MGFRRRSSMVATPMVHKMLEEEDSLDEALERRSRQKKRQSAVGLTPVRDESPKKSAAFLAEHYTNCIKLSAENKINVKNAFSLKLIDYMAEKFSSKGKKGVDEGNNFQAASCALDASTKIYAYRVDSVHTDALKLAEGVGSTAEEKKGSGCDAQEEEDEEGLLTQKKKTQKRSKSTVEKNIKNITLSKFEMTLDVDPLFKKTTSQYDTGGGGNYFINTLLELNDDAKLVWDPDALLHQHNYISTHLEDWELSVKISKESVADSVTCPAFEGFNFKEWKLEEDDLNSSIIGFSQPMTSTQKDDEHAFDINAPVPEDFDDFTAADAVIDNIPPNSAEEPIMESHINVQLKSHGMVFTDNLREILTSVPLEYSYFDNSRMGSFAGPKHWKFRQQTIRAEIEDDKKLNSKKKTQKEDQPLEFTQIDEKSSCLQTVLRLMGKPKKTTRLQQKTVQSWTEDKRMCPEELRYKGSDFVNLDCIDIIPSKLSKNWKSVQSNRDQDTLEDIDNYDYDNPNDAENFCPADMDTENYDEPRTMNNDDHSVEYDGLVSAPNKVEKINISYAKLAKKVDMKRLKYVEWDILRSEEEEKENLNDNESEETTRKMKGIKKFSQLFKSLETSTQMPVKMVENLSVPLAFAALLHLCNEHSLKLEGSQDLRDFIISQG